MKILYYFAETPKYMEAWQRFHIFNELEYHGIFIEVFNPLKFNSIEEANDALLKKTQVQHYDLFMTCHASEWFVPGTIEKIRQAGNKTLLICFDNMHAPFMHKRIAHEFDLVWLTSRENSEKFSEWKCRKTIVMPYAANPHAFEPQWRGRRIPRISFVGTPYGSRASLLNSLAENGLTVELFHGGNKLLDEGQRFSLTPPRKTRIQSIMECISFAVGRKLILSRLLSALSCPAKIKNLPTLIRSASVPFDEMLYVYSNYALSLNSLVLRNTGCLKKPLFKLHLRTFEIPMSGGLEFAQRSDELQEYFEENKEIVLFDSSAEMVDKAKFYLREENTGIIDEMKRAARKRAKSEHSWSCRFRKVFQQLEIKNAF